MLDAPDSLRESIGPAPHANPDGTVVILVCETDEQVAAGGVVVRADHSDAGLRAAIYSAAAKVFGAWPVTQFLTALLLLQGQETLLPGAFHKIGHILLVCVYDTMQVFSPLRRIRVAVPADRGDEGFNLETVGIRHQTDGRLIVVRLHICRPDISQHNYTRLKSRLLLLGFGASKNSQEEQCYNIKFLHNKI